MAHDESTQKPPRPVEVVARRMREVRETRRLTAAQLADLMRAAGIPWDRQIVTNLETGRRQAVSVDELLALAVVLQVAPIHLLVPLDGEQPYRVTPEWVQRAIRVREWVRGTLPLRPEDRRLYYSEIPDNEWEMYAGMRGDEGGRERLLESQIRASRKVLEMLERQRDQEENADG
jgi:transcriptional regulator with XRE-family HTH domain